MGKTRLNDGEMLENEDSGRLEGSVGLGLAIRFSGVSTQGGCETRD